MNRTTVYLIDDEEQLISLFSKVVELAGLKARGFTQASHFFEQVTVFEPCSILVLDLHMPEMDGIEVMRRLAQMEDAPKLILVSGHDVGVLHAAEKLGKAHNLKILSSMTKPVSINRLQQLLACHEPGSAGQYRQGPQAALQALTPTELDQAIRDDQMVLHYQPQIEIATGRLFGVEALVRWQHPELGLIYPDRFISLAEQNGLMQSLTHWVIKAAVQQEQQWLNEGASMSISVNISALDITSLTLPEQLGDLLAEKMLDPTRLTLEVTESALMGELVTSLDILTRLRLKGIGLSIDDFGTGYSSLSQLHRVPFTELKIDLSFVSAMVEDAEARAIVKTCILLGHELNMLVVAEGVETEEHLKLLKVMGCDVAQGYFFSRPMPGSELLSWAEAHLQ
jgi:EAL domain-containing protein (putative c-di-GMP-specific phosphodiesterase class I)/FixJ family two-component response regulator